MQAGGTVQAAPMTPRGRRLNVLLVIVALVALVAVAGILLTRGAAEDVPVFADPQWVTLYDEEGIAHQVHVRTESVAQEAQWMSFYDDEGNEHQVLVR